MAHLFWHAIQEALEHDKGALALVGAVVGAVVAWVMVVQVPETCFITQYGLDELRRRSALSPCGLAPSQARASVSRLTQPGSGTRAARRCRRSRDYRDPRGGRPAPP